MGFEVADQRAPVLPLTHHWIDSSTTHGTLLMEKGVEIIPSGLLSSQQYWSSAILLTMDADPVAAAVPTASIETALPLSFSVSAGRVGSVFMRGKHHRWRKIRSVAADPSLQAAVERLRHDLEALAPG